MKPSPERPTLKTIARRLGLSSAAVSLALRNHPSIPPATCLRVQRTAARLGYQRDPEIAKLMSYLRHSRTTRGRGTLGIITQFPQPSPWRTIPHLELLYTAAVDRARLQGYALDEYWLAEPGMTPTRLREVLLARGIEGLLLLGAPRWTERLEFDFTPFACAATGYSVRNELHRACQHQYQEMFLALQQLEALGYRRPGLSLTVDADARTMHHWSAAFLSFQSRRPAFHRLPLLLAPRLSAEVFAPWFLRHRPDVVISQSPPVPTVVGWLRELGVAVPRDCGVADLDIDPHNDLDCSGIQQNYREVAIAAVDLVVEQIQRGEHGVPDHPRVVLIRGKWVDGATTRAHAPSSRS
ncbi:MAG: LacI family DNA-binding transcriptional regulator [Verrucomicrobia bacterium]|nr:LacI family DNA-binding transcriptional regulator [Verrucomicrobiota bacterium]